MDPVTRTQVRLQIQDAKQRIPAIEADIADAKKAGLADVVKAQEIALQKMKDFLTAIEKVYG